LCQNTSIDIEAEQSRAPRPGEEVKGGVGEARAIAVHGQPPDGSQFGREGLPGRHPRRPRRPVGLEGFPLDRLQLVARLSRRNGRLVVVAIVAAAAAAAAVALLRGGAG
jgi:hypothetical protein